MESATTLPATMSVEEAGRVLGVSRRSAYRAVARGEIPSVKVGRRLLVPTQRLFDLLGIPIEGAAAPELGRH
jgi:excisionase family DNA binding protein